jgi:CRP-like cAMP-binding protein
MIDDFLEQLENSQLYKLATTKFIPALDVYVGENTFYNRVLYIKRGLLRGYYVTDTGEEKTVFFYWEGQSLAIPECIYGKKPSRQTLQTLEDCEVLEVDFDLIDELSRKDHAVMAIRAENAERLLLQPLNRLEGFVLDSPEMRYLNLMNSQPEIFSRVKCRYIASYIGVTPVSLSRIRKRLLKKNN